MFNNSEGTGNSLINDISAVAHQALDQGGPQGTQGTQGTTGAGTQGTQGTQGTTAGSGPGGSSFASGFMMEPIHSAEGNSKSLITDLDPSTNPLMSNGLLWLNTKKSGSGWTATTFDTPHMSTSSRYSGSWVHCPSGHRFYDNGLAWGNSYQGFLGGFGVVAATPYLATIPAPSSPSTPAAIDVSGRFGHKMVALGGKIYVAGGAQSDSIFIQDVNNGQPNYTTTYSNAVGQPRAACTLNFGITMNFPLLGFEQGCIDAASATNLKSSWFAPSSQKLQDIAYGSGGAIGGSQWSYCTNSSECQAQDLFPGAPGAGGDNANTATLPYFHVYDPSSGQWTRLADLPPTGSPNVHVPPDASQNITRAEAWDLTAPYFGAATSGMPLSGRGYGGLVALPPGAYFSGAYNPGGRRAFGMATLDGKIWVAGGITGADPDLVDASGRRFTPCHPGSLDISPGVPRSTTYTFNTARRVFTATSVVAALMTKTHAKVLDKVHCYDPSTNVWTEVAPLPVPVWGNTLTAIGNKLYSVGGFLYGTRQFAWELPSPQYYETGGTGYNNVRRVDTSKTYSLDASNAATNAVYIYTPPLPGQDGSGVWTAGPPLNQGRAFHTCTAVGSELHVIGGEAENFTGAVTAWTGIPTPWQSGAKSSQGNLCSNDPSTTWTINLTGAAAGNLGISTNSSWVNQEANGVAWGYVHVTFNPPDGYNSPRHQIIQDTSAVEILSLFASNDVLFTWTIVNVPVWKPRTRHTAAAYGGGILLVGGTNLDPSENTFPIGMPPQRTGGDQCTVGCTPPNARDSDYYGNVTPAISEFFAPGTWNGIGKNDVWLPSRRAFLPNPQSIIPDLSANVFPGEKGGSSNNMEGWVFDPSAGYATSSSAMTIVNNKMFLFGGRRSAWAPSSFHFITTDVSNSPQAAWKRMFSVMGPGQSPGGLYLGNSVGGTDWTGAGIPFDSSYNIRARSFLGPSFEDSNIMYSCDLSSISQNILFTFQGEDFYVPTSRGGPKTFIIPHPEYEGKMLRHACLEAPTRGTNVYEYQIEVTEPNHTTTIPLPSYFKHINGRGRVYVNAADKSAWGGSSGYVNANLTAAIIETERTGTFNIMITCVRKDAEAIAYSAIENIDAPIAIEDIPKKSKT